MTIKRPLRIAATNQLLRSVREAGYEAVLLPDTIVRDFHRSTEDRIEDGRAMEAFLGQHDVDLVLDFNTEALALAAPQDPGQPAQLVTERCGVKYAAMYLDPITSTMGRANWTSHWQLLESDSWIKGIFEDFHAEELRRLGVRNIIKCPMGAAVDDFDTSPLPEPDPGPIVAFMGHPASSWFSSNQGVLPRQLFSGLVAAGACADRRPLPFHEVYFDLYELDRPPGPDDSPEERARKAQAYFSHKFFYNAYLAVRQRDRFAHFLKGKLGDRFELIGDHWGENYGLNHTPRIWDMKRLHDRMRRVPICLNLLKGNIESGLIVRHFEVTAYGGFLLTYPTPELERFFRIGEECDIFRDEHELIEKIRFYLENPDKRRQIAAAGQRRTLREHLYSHRINMLVSNLFGDVGARQAAGSGVTVENPTGSTHSRLADHVKSAKAAAPSSGLRIIVNAADDQPAQESRDLNRITPS